MKRDSMVLYRSFVEAAAGLPAEDFKACFLAVARYAMDGIEPADPDPIVNLFFTLARPQIDANNRRYENGKRGGRPAAGRTEKTSKKPNQNQTETKQKPKNSSTKPNVNGNGNVNENENVNVNANVYVNENANEGENTHAPKIEDVISFFVASGMTEEEANRFYSYNQMKGWKVGKSHIEDWKQAARIWQSRQRDFASGNKPADRFGQFEQRQYDYDELEKCLQCRAGPE